MIRAVCLVVLINLAVASAQNTEQRPPVSPCPDIFTYDQWGTEQGKWYGNINLTTDIVLYGLWLNIVLDEKADILGNWLGEVSTKDNIDFKVENSQMKINPGPPIAVRFFVQYNSKSRAPILKAIRLNGEEICNINKQRPEIALVIPDTVTKANRTDTRNLPWAGSNAFQDTTAKPDKIKPTVRIDTKSRTENIKFEVVNRNVSSKFEVKKPDTGIVANIPAKSSRPDFRTGTTKTDSNRFDTTSSRSDSNRDDFFYDRSSSQFSSSNAKSRPGSNGFATTSTTSASSLNSYGDNESYDDKDYDDYVGGIPTIFIPSNIAKGSYSSKKVQCGKVVFNSSRSEMIENGVVSLEGQYPWQIAIYQNQRSGENKYICGGTLVSRRHVITAAHCVTRRGGRKIVNRNTLTMYLGKHNLRTSVDGVQIKFVEKISVHPNYNATTLSRDIAIIQLKESVTYTDHVLPICLWPDTLVDLSSIIGKHGSLVGWGFEDTGAAKQELSLVKMPVVDSDTCVKSYSNFFARILSEYSYCASYAEDTSVCNSDSGGGMIFKSEDTWYLRGVASLSVARQDQFRCDPNHYVIFTDVAKFLPWIKDNVYDY